MLYRSMLVLGLLFAAAPAFAQTIPPLTQDKAVTGGDCIPETKVIAKVVDSKGWTNYRIDFINNCPGTYWIYADPIPADPANPPTRAGALLEPYQSAYISCYFSPAYPARTCKGFDQVNVERR